MAWSDFTAGLFTSGQILTAAQMNTYVRDNLLAGGPIYATEAARNAAIPSPFEGQRAYITGATVPAATGLVTAVPTGIQTVYNGSAWVCVTPVSANTVTNGTTTSGSFTPTLTSGGTNPSVTIATGTTALVMLSAVTQEASGFTHSMSFAVSGATTLAATDNYGPRTASTVGTFRMSDQLVITGLTAGTNTFTLQYTTAGGTANFSRRGITVMGIA